MAKFERRHYRQFALEVYLRGKTEAERLELARDRAYELRGTNPNFDRERFIDACLSGLDKSSWRSKRATVKL